MDDQKQQDDPTLGKGIPRGGTPSAGGTDEGRKIAAAMEYEEGQREMWQSEFDFVVDDRQWTQYDANLKIRAPCCWTSAVLELKYLRAGNLIHRDLTTTTSILLFDIKGPDVALKIAEFVIARPPDEGNKPLLPSRYMAPEILGYKLYDASADGILFEMGKPPFTGSNHIQLLNRINTTELKFPPDIKLSSNCVSLLTGLQFFTYPHVVEAIAMSVTTHKKKEKASQTTATLQGALHSLRNSGGGQSADGSSSSYVVIDPETNSGSAAPAQSPTHGHQPAQQAHSHARVPLDSASEFARVKTLTNRAQLIASMGDQRLAALRGSALQLLKDVENADPDEPLVRDADQQPTAQSALLALSGQGASLQEQLAAVLALYLKALQQLAMIVPLPTQVLAQLQQQSGAAAGADGDAISADVERWDEVARWLPHLMQRYLARSQLVRRAIEELEQSAAGGASASVATVRVGAISSRRGSVASSSQCGSGSGSGGEEKSQCAGSSSSSDLRDPSGGVVPRSPPLVDGSAPLHSSRLSLLSTACAEKQLYDELLLCARDGIFQEYLACFAPALHYYRRALQLLDLLLAEPDATDQDRAKLDRFRRMVSARIHIVQPKAEAAKADKVKVEDDGNKLYMSSFQPHSPSSSHSKKSVSPAAGSMMSSSSSSQHEHGPAQTNRVITNPPINDNLVLKTLDYNVVDDIVQILSVESDVVQTFVEVQANFVVVVNQPTGLAMFFETMKRNLVTMGLSDVEKSVVKATYDDELAPKEKHVVFLTECTSQFDVVSLFDRRLTMARWNVVFKALIVLHRLSIEGAERYMKDLVLHHEKKNSRIIIFGSARHHEGFIVKYTKYLSQKVYVYKLLGVSVERLLPIEFEEWARQLSGPELIQALSALSQQFDLLLACSPYEGDLMGLAVAALQLLGRDASRMFGVLAAMMSGVMDCFHELDAPQTKLILSVCTALKEQNARFKRWTQQLASVGFAHDDTLFPDFVPMLDTLIELLQDCKIAKGGVRQAPAAAQPGRKTTLAVAVAGKKAAPAGHKQAGGRAAAADSGSEDPSSADGLVRREAADMAVSSSQAHAGAAPAPAFSKKQQTAAAVAAAAQDDSEESEEEDAAAAAAEAARKAAKKARKEERRLKREAKKEKAANFK